MVFIDAHCHLDLVEKEVKDIDSVIKKCKEKKIIIVTDGIDVRTNRKTLELAEKYDNVKACLGIYPDNVLRMDSKDILKEIEFIRRNKNKIIGIGEVGMDFSKTDYEGDYEEEIMKQKNFFENFVKLAIELDKPIIVHSRKAEEACISVLEKLKAKKVVMHYFSGGMNLVKRIIDNGWFLSIPTAVKNSEHFQNVVKLADIENLLCESDSPYSHPDKKFPNTPINIIESYKMIAKIKGMALREVEKKIEGNFKRLFEI